MNQFINLPHQTKAICPNLTGINPFITWSPFKNAYLKIPRNPVVIEKESVRHP